MRKTTLIDVANMANVSKTTASMVLNNKPINVSERTRKEIKHAAKVLNYIPNNIARSLSTKRTNTIGIVLPDIENPFFAQISKAIENKAEEFSYNVMLCNSYNKPHKEIEQIKLLIGKLVDGVIFASSGKDLEGLKLLKENNVPFVLLDRYCGELDNISGVFCSNEDGIKLGIEYLYRKGKKKIAFVRGERGVAIADLRYSIYERIAKQYCIFNKDLIFEGSFDIDGGMKSTNKILGKVNEIDAIFYSSDIMALGGMKILKRNGFEIPKDISILGYDNINISEIVEPELTTVAQPIFEMGQRSLELLMDIISGNSINENIVLKPKLIERGTVL